MIAPRRTQLVSQALSASTRVFRDSRVEILSSKEGFILQLCHMEFDLPAGKYIVAVSGGVDSVVLLHSLLQAKDAPKKLDAQHPKLEFVVAHFDHGIRPDSAADCDFVRQLAAHYGLSFVSERAELGVGASEAKAREARYTFLRHVRIRYAADAIITAHHEDDVLETIIINWLRGTRSRGLSSLRSTAEIRRPLLGMSKKQIRAYAHAHNLRWREDSTNTDERYLRNYIRRRFMTKLETPMRKRLLDLSAQAAQVNSAVDALVREYLAQHMTAATIDRQIYRSLPPEVSCEVLAAWLRNHTQATITTKTLLRLDGALRTGRNGSLVDVAKGQSFRLTAATAHLQ
jgi:tRNA(Ile)-lysidine synthetase-like protein